MALLGCGGFGMPLAHHARARGVSSVYLGGYLPVLFGVAGKYHRAQAQVHRHINDAWVRPLPEETPEGKEAVEGGVYW